METLLEGLIETQRRIRVARRRLERSRDRWPFTVPEQAAACQQLCLGAVNQMSDIVSSAVAGMRARIDGLL